MTSDYLRSDVRCQTLDVKLMNLILIGPQGSGKGTQAQKLAEYFNLTIVEMGGILRKISKQDHPRSKVINNLINEKGQLLPDGIVLEILIEHLNQLDWKNGVVFDGYPRSVKQFLLLENFLSENNHFIHLALYLNIPDQVGIDRLSNRLTCSQCSRVYNLKTTPPPQKNTCQCGGNLFQRADDHPEAIQHRLNQYHQETQPILDLLKEKGILTQIDASQEPNHVFQNIKQAIEKKQKRLGNK